MKLSFENIEGFHLIVLQILSPLRGQSLVLTDTVIKYYIWTGKRLGIKASVIWAVSHFKFIGWSIPYRASQFSRTITGFLKSSSFSPSILSKRIYYSILIKSKEMSPVLSPKICISRFLFSSNLGRMHYIPTVIHELLSPA